MNRPAQDAAGRGRKRPSPAALLGALLALGLVSLAPAWAEPEPQHQGAHPQKAVHKETDAAHAKHDSSASHTPSSMEHVVDDPTGNWHLFTAIEPQHIHLPYIGWREKGIGFQLTKFMVLELIAAGLVMLVYIPLARRLSDGRPPRGAFENTFEVFLTFVRDSIAKPNLGEHDADKYVPFLWTVFLFILFNNLLGMLPFLGSATGSIYVTLGLAILAFFAIHGCAIAKMGFGHYVASMWPHIDLPGPLGLVIKPLVFFLEVFGVLVRNLVLAVRLFANMFAGHMVLATILIFVYMAKDLHPLLWGTITAGSVGGMIALSLLELFVAFLQAYIFTFLTSLFMGMALHPQH